MRVRRFVLLLDSQFVHRLQPNYSQKCIELVISIKQCTLAKSQQQLSPGLEMHSVLTVPQSLQHRTILTRTRRAKYPTARLNVIAAIYMGRKWLCTLPCSHIVDFLRVCQCLRRVPTLTGALLANGIVARTALSPALPQRQEIDASLGAWRPQKRRRDFTRQ